MHPTYFFLMFKFLLIWNITYLYSKVKNYFWFNYQFNFKEFNFILKYLAYLILNY